MDNRTEIFSKLVRDFMRTVPLAVAKGSSLADAVAGMVRENASSATIIDTDARPVGIVTEQDITRRAAFKLDGTALVDAVMTARVYTISEDEYLYYAIARMRRRGLHHMPVVDGHGVLKGMINLADAIAAASETLMGEIDTLTQENSIDGLKLVKAAQVALVERLTRDNLPVNKVQALLTHINNDIYRRAVNLNLAAMADEGLGQPPVNFSVIVMGSGGRGENFLFPDQDNGMILDDYPNEQHTEIDAWFINLAERVTRDLDQVGLPLCKGFVMATNPLWRKTATQWKEQIQLWSQKRNITTLRLCDIFFDFRSVWGDEAKAKELRTHVTQIAGNNPLFLREMYEDDIEHGVALGWFGRLLTEKENKDFKGQLNLKHTGTLPLVEAMRLLALRGGIEKISTLDRMAALRDAGALSDDEHEYLSNAFVQISGLLLRQQISDFKGGRRVSNYVHPKTLSRREHNMLVDSFKVIQALREKVKSEFTGEVF